MLYRLPSVLALAVLAIVAVGCSGGAGGSGAKFNRAACASGDGDTTFCLTSCSLGCSVGGCSVTDIAVNQPLTFTFSQAVDPTSVNFSTISIKTPTGQTPKGDLVVRDNIVEFLPKFEVVAGNPRFGFISGETYLLTLPNGGESGNVLRSTSGDGLSELLTCSLRVNRGIVDLDQSPPKARLISPQVTSNAAKDTVIVLEFSEIIDITPFIGATTQTTPVEYVMRKTMQKPGGLPGERVCDPNSARQILEGQPEAVNDEDRKVTTVTLRPAVPLPNQICIEILVTDEVHDLANIPAVPHSFTFTTEIVVVGEGQITETFAGDTQLDKTVSSGIWGGGCALPPVIGGTGIHGSFDITDGAATKDPFHYIWNTDNVTIPKAHTLNKKTDIKITDGLFQFTEFRVPPGFTISFVGTKPVQLRVRGEARIEGIVNVNAQNAPSFEGARASGFVPFGQAGPVGGPGGARGGQGGDACLNTGPATRFAGRPGNSVRLPKGNSYATQAQGTGGRGSPMFPANGVNTIFCALNNTFAPWTAAGGGGGGFDQKGGDGKVTLAPCHTKYQGKAPNSGGKAFALGSLANGSTTNDSSLDFYAVGGSGGGGGGSHPLLTLSGRWLPGSAGAGGGGIIAFRVGQDFIMRPGSSIRAKGGSGFNINGVGYIFNVPSPGGGGSGGSILMQVFGSTSLLGTLDTSGGKGGVLDNRFAGHQPLRAFSRGGDGSPGYYRLETRNGPSLSVLGLGTPVAKASNGGVLKDKEFGGVSQSKFYSTQLIFPPNYLRYEVEAFVGNVAKLYTDDPEIGNPQSPRYNKNYAGLASQGKPIYFQVQGAKVNILTGQPDLLSLGPWRDRVFEKSGQDLNKDKATGLRFSLTYDNAAAELVVKRVSVFYVE